MPDDPAKPTPPAAQPEIPDIPQKALEDFAAAFAPAPERPMAAPTSVATPAQPEPHPTSASEPIPMIRGLNPPTQIVIAANRLAGQNRALLRAAYIALALAIVLYLVRNSLPDRMVYGLMPVCFPVLPFVFWSWSRSNDKQLARIGHPFTLTTYNTEFTSVLADTSTLTTNIHFQIDLAHANTATELNRQTEMYLLKFVSPKTAPPPAQEIEDHLKRQLLRFQNETGIDVLRLDVSLNIHHPPKKGSVYV